MSNMALDMDTNAAPKFTQTARTQTERSENLPQDERMGGSCAKDVFVDIFLLSIFLKFRCLAISSYEHLEPPAVKPNPD